MEKYMVTFLLVILLILGLIAFASLHVTNTSVIGEAHNDVSSDDDVLSYTENSTDLHRLWNHMLAAPDAETEAVIAERINTVSNDYGIPYELVASNKETGAIVDINQYDFSIGTDQLLFSFSIDDHAPPPPALWTPIDNANVLLLLRE